MRKFWMVLLSLSFVTLVACSNEDKNTDTAEKSTDEKTEEVEKDETTETEEESSETEESEDEATEDEENSNTTNKSLYDESKATTNIMKKEANGLNSSIEMKHADDVLLEQTQIT